MKTMFVLIVVFAGSSQLPMISAQLIWKIWTAIERSMTVHASPPVSRDFELLSMSHEGFAPAIFDRNTIKVLQETIHCTGYTFCTK